MHLAPIVSDEQQDERVVCSRSATAMGADIRWRRSEVVVDPLCDEAALIGLAHAERVDEFRLEPTEHRHKVGWWIVVVFEDEVAAFDQDCDAG